MVDRWHLTDGVSSGRKPRDTTLGREPVRQAGGMGKHVDRARLGLAKQRLRATGRGKHVGGFSYYHADLIVQVPGAWEFLQKTRQLFKPPNDFNVVRVSHSRLSFLHYERFSLPFPALRYFALLRPLKRGEPFHRLFPTTQSAHPAPQGTAPPGRPPAGAGRCPPDSTPREFGSVHRREDDRYPRGLAVATRGVGLDSRGGRELVSGAGSFGAHGVRDACFATDL